MDEFLLHDEPQKQSTPYKSGLKADHGFAQPVIVLESIRPRILPSASRLILQSPVKKH